MKPLVDHLATLHGGVRPEVRSLAIPGELYAVIDGRQLELTNIGKGDVQPNQASYQVLSGAFISAVPEPTSLPLLSFFRGLMLLRRPERRTLVGQLSMAA